MPKDTFTQRYIKMTKLVDGEKVVKILDASVATTIPLVLVHDKILKANTIDDTLNVVLKPEDKLISLTGTGENEEDRFVLTGKIFDLKTDMECYILYDGLFEDILILPDYTTINFKKYNKTPSYEVTVYRLGSGKHMPHYTTSYNMEIPTSKNDEQYVPISKTKADIVTKSFLVDTFGIENKERDPRGNSYYEIPRTLNNSQTVYGIMDFNSNPVTLISLGKVSDFLEDPTNNNEGLPIFEVYKVDTISYALRFLDRNAIIDDDSEVYFYLHL